MKNISFIILAISGLIFSTMGTSCQDDTPPTKPKDTTVNEEPKVNPNKLRIGFTDYEIVANKDKTFGIFTASKNSTYVGAYGIDVKTSKSVDFTIEFPGKDTGTYTTHNSGGAVFECGTDEVGTVRREDFSADNSDLTVVVTEYGAVGEKIKGTFTGQMKNGKTGVTISVTRGQFEVTRRDDK